ncbi:MAG TPA: Rrf2 family transcriptional regulator [Candidatus Polarisedimenticolia bacterium]|nr:Rrf2 family transcriptional regulator [Candidatus Polarisedimenticolia bacterium]
MKLNKSTRYALYAALEMAQAEDDAQVTVAQVAGRYGVPEAALAKVFQRLVRSGIATGTRGVGGGYRLAKEPSKVTVLDVVSAFEPPRPLRQCLIQDRPEPCANLPTCRLKRLFDEVDENTRSTFASVTLDTLAGKRGLLPVPASGPGRKAG